MMKRSMLLALMVCLTAGLPLSASAAQTLMVLGRNAFCVPPLSSEADLRKLVENRSEELRAGFAKAGSPELFPAFYEQFPKAAISPVRISSGETFQWMLFKKKESGTIRVVKNVSWGGAEPFDAYTFVIRKDDMLYRFVVPNRCGNLALKTVEPIPVAAAVQTPVAAPVTPKPAAVVPPPPAPVAAATPVPAPIVPKPVVVVASPPRPPLRSPPRPPCLSGPCRSSYRHPRRSPRSRCPWRRSPEVRFWTSATPTSPIPRTTCSHAWAMRFRWRTGSSCWG